MRPLRSVLSKPYIEARPVGKLHRLSSMMWDKRQVVWSLMVLALALWLGAAVTGCRVVQGAADLPGNTVRVVTPGKSKGGVDPAELQQQLLRFADQYLAGLLAAVDQLEGSTPELTREMVQQIRLGYAGDIWMAASGPNTYADLLDLVTVITLSRIVIEEYWVPDVFGDSALPLLEVARTSEEDIWAIAATVLTAKQQKELREAIQQWREENPKAEHAMYVRAVGLAGRMAESKSHDREGPSSVFGLLMIDPLSGLDPAKRELAQTRLTAERALYVAQRMPFMLRWQMERWSAYVADLPETRQLLTNAAQLGDAAETLSRTAEQLPDRFSEERREIVEILRSEQETLRDLSAEARGTLNAGSQMASNTHLALMSFDAVVQRLQQSNSDSNAEPFRIRDYTEAAGQLDATALRLSDLLQQLNEMLASTNLHGLAGEVAPALESVESSGRQLVDHAFRRLVLVLVIGCVLFLATAVCYRRLASGAGERRQV